MSAALVRQALEFVDPDESKRGSRKTRGGRSRGAAGQEPATQDNNKVESNKQGDTTKRAADGDSEKTREVISKLLKLSETTFNKEISLKIVKRAVSGKPVFDKIKIKQEVVKSILFPDDDPPKKKKYKKRY